MRPAGMRLRRTGAVRAGQTNEVRGIAVLRLALVPIALLTQSSHSDLSSDLFPWVIAAFAVYATGSLLIAFVSPRAPRLSLVPALIDLCFVALLVAVTGGEYSSLRFAFYVLPIAAALRLSPKLTASWAALSVIAYLAVTLPHPDTILPEDLGSLIEDSLSLLWVASAAVMLSAMVGRRQRAVVEFAEMRRELVQQALDAEANQQRRLAEALHDHAVQNVLLARQELTDVVRGVPGAQERARAALDETDRQLRHEIFALHPLGLKQAGLGAVLDSLAEDAGHRGGFDATVRVSPRAERSGHHDLIIATVRELLTNVAKHAHAQRVDVDLRRKGQTLQLTVTDDGVGIEPGQVEMAISAGHIGLAAIGERIRSQGGRLDIDPSTNGGTTIRVTIPPELVPSENGRPRTAHLPGRRDQRAAHGRGPVEP
jgi:two-component system, NarL family, sensor kinase